jgi:hypothetical protein
MLVGMAPLHHQIDAIEPAREELMIGLETQGIRHDAQRIRQHAVIGDDGVAFDVNISPHREPVSITVEGSRIYNADPAGICRGVILWIKDPIFVGLIGVSAKCQNQQPFFT